jgi:dGTPase
MLAAYACNPNNSRGRLHAEDESQHRSAFQRDRDRIIHSTAFRRLMHKTQVFVAHEGGLFRTRLTHTIEVGQVARTIASVLNLNMELTEAVALAHDLGHTPFGHNGEDVLAACMATYGGFDHNAQALKIVTNLERHYAGFDGLNLTWETLEAIAKHNGPVTGNIPFSLEDYNETHDLELETYASAEAQSAAIADDIAYNNHDLDDGLRAGLFTVDDIIQLPLVGTCFQEVDHSYPNLDPERRRHEALRRVFGIMVQDVVAESQARITALAPQSAQDIRNHSAPVIQFSDSLFSQLKEIRSFLFARMYRHKNVNAMRERTGVVVRDLFDTYMDKPQLLPEHRQPTAAGKTAQARAIADYIAGMTDQFAFQEHEKHCA